MTDPQRNLRRACEFAVVAAVAVGCANEVPAPQAMTPGATGTGTAATTTTGGVDTTTTGTTTGGATTTTGGVQGDFPQPTDCVGEQVGGAKRVVRLTFPQLVNSIRGLLGDTLAATLVTNYEIDDPTERTFPPLANLNEGGVITDVQWQKGDGIAETSADYVFDNYTTVTGCADVNDATCAQTYLTTFAAQAYRRPLDERESTRLLQVFTEVQGRSTVQDAVKFGVYAVLESPQFLYRTEFGGDASVASALTPHELASQLSYFITDAAPDQPLLDAAQGGSLATRDGIAAEASRLLATDAARVNLQTAMLAYFGFPNMFSVIIDPAVAPDFNSGLASAMFHEGELFLNNTLWTGVVDDLLLSKTTWVNQELGTLYGATITSAADADGFAQIEMPVERSGLLTQAGFLTARSRPNTPSVVGRGLLVNATLLCVQNPAFPENLADTVEAVNASLEGYTEREKAEYRANDASCGACHTAFDPYGVALENFDIIGKYRTVDSEGRAIDASVTLPPAAGGAMVANAAAMAQEIALSGGFARCLAKNLLGYALAEGAVALDSCSVQAVVDDFNQTDKTFTSLVREVAISQTLMQRSGGT